jgi:uncharacterized protein (TIGR03067 family)
VKQFWFAGALALLACVSSGRCEDDKKPKGDAKAFEGTWLAESAVMGGNAFPEALRKSIRLEIKDGKYTVTVGAAVDKGSCKFDESKKIKTMDVTGEEGPNKGKTFPAIYELKGDMLKVCYDLSGTKRPEEFVSKPGTMLFLATYKKQKP